MDMNTKAGADADISCISTYTLLSTLHETLERLKLLSNIETDDNGYYELGIRLHRFQIFCKYSSLLTSVCTELLRQIVCNCHILNKRSNFGRTL